MCYPAEREREIQIAATFSHAIQNVTFDAKLKRHYIKRETNNNCRSVGKRTDGQTENQHSQFRCSR